MAKKVFYPSSNRRHYLILQTVHGNGLAGNGAVKASTERAPMTREVRRTLENMIMEYRKEPITAAPGLES